MTLWQDYRHRHRCPHVNNKTLLYLLACIYGIFLLLGLVVYVILIIAVGKFICAHSVSNKEKLHDRDLFTVII